MKGARGNQGTLFAHFVVRVRLRSAAARQLNLKPAVHSVWESERLAHITRDSLVGSGLCADADAWVDPH